MNKLKLRAHLIFRARDQSLRVVTRSPNLDWDEMAWSVEVTVPLSWGRLAGSIKLDMPEGPEPTVDVQLHPDFREESTDVPHP